MRKSQKKQNQKPRFGCQISAHSLVKKNKLKFRLGLFTNTMCALLTQPHFFKPLLPGFEDEFIIPAAFFKYFNGKKCEKAVLKSRQKGKLWPVKINGKKFGDGWKQFVQDHDLQIGDFLVFRHEGDLVFYVVVFGRTTCEREYPPFTATEDEPSEIQEQSPPKDSSSDHPRFTPTEGDPIEIEEQNLPKESSSCKDHPRFTAREEDPVEIEEQNLRKDSSSGEDHPHFTSTEEEPIEIEEQNLPKVSSSDHPRFTATEEEPVEIEEQNLQRFSSDHPRFSATEEEPIEIDGQNLQKDSISGKKFKLKKKVLTELELKARSSMTEHPSCLITLTEYTFKSSRVNIPSKFAREHGLYGRCCMLILKDEKGNCWPAKLVYKSSDFRTFISSGWKDFHIAHKLQPGDLMIVELTRNGKIPVFKMRRLLEHQKIKQEKINQNNEEADSSSPRKKSRLEIPEATEKVYGSWKSRNNIQPENSVEAKASSSVVQQRFFVAEVTLQSKLYIPANLAKLDFRNTNYNNVKLIDRKGKSYPAILRRKNSDGQIYVAYGWNKFRVANNLKPGDSFVFESIKKSKSPAFKIYDFKANHKAGNYQVAFSSIEKPCFYVTMKSSDVRDGQIRIPADFALRSGIADYSISSEMTIKNEMGNSWQVTLKDDDNNNGDVFIKYGWSEFAEANGIKEGDVFMLELVKGGATPLVNYYAAKQQMESNKKGMWKD